LWASKPVGRSKTEKRREEREERKPEKGLKESGLSTAITQSMQEMLECKL
jgi:hypothetical protein